MLRIKYRLPRQPRIRRFPHAPADRAKIKNIRAARHARHRHRASSAERPNQPPVHAAVEVLVNLLRARTLRRKRAKNHQSDEGSNDKIRETPKMAHVLNSPWETRLRNARVYTRGTTLGYKTWIIKLRFRDSAIH